MVVVLEFPVDPPPEITRAASFNLVKVPLAGTIKPVFAEVPLEDAAAVLVTMRLASED